MLLAGLWISFLHVLIILTVDHVEPRQSKWRFLAFNEPQNLKIIPKCHPAKFSYMTTKARLANHSQNKKKKNKENDRLFQSSNGTTGLITNRRNEKAAMLFYFHTQSSVILTSLNKILCPTLFPQGKKSIHQLKIGLSVKVYGSSQTYSKSLMQYLKTEKFSLFFLIFILNGSRKIFTCKCSWTVNSERILVFMQFW